MKLYPFSPVLIVAVLSTCGASAGDGPSPGTPPEFRDAWLRYHESELCESLDAVFVFRARTLEVWVAPGTEKDAQKLREQLAPLQSAGRLEFYAPRAPTESRPPGERMPPPGLWNNGQLRQYLQDPFLGGRSANGTPSLEPAAPGDRSLRLRMNAYAEQLLEWNGKLRRFAEHLPDLATSAYSPNSPADLKKRAAAACQSHIREIGRLADRLQKNLEPAIPRADRRTQPKNVIRSSVHASSPDATVRKFAAEAATLARRTRRFVYPRTHTVGLEDLKEPDLLGSLQELRSAAPAIADSVSGRR